MLKKIFWKQFLNSEFVFKTPKYMHPKNFISIGRGQHYNFPKIYNFLSDFNIFNSFQQNSISKTNGNIIFETFSTRKNHKTEVYNRKPCRKSNLLLSIAGVGTFSILSPILRVGALMYTTPTHIQIQVTNPSPPCRTSC
jgi:hypothetical protein